MTRAEIPQTTVRYAYMIEPGTGYILLTTSRALLRRGRHGDQEARAQGMKRLLFDLRNNGGGLLDQAIDIADQFLPKDALVVETRGRTRDSFQQFTAAGITLRSRSGGRPGEQRYRVGVGDRLRLIQDHDVGLIVGVPTRARAWSNRCTTSYGAGLAPTTAKYSRRPAV